MTLKMVNHCAWGTCVSDSEKKDPSIKFVAFPNPKKNRDLAKTWVRRCGRVNFTLKNVRSSTSICSLHFPAGEVLNVRANPTLVPFPAQPEAEALYKRKNPKPETVVDELPSRKEGTASSPKVYYNKRRRQAATTVPVPIEVKVSTPTKIDVKPAHSTPVKIVFPGSKDADEPLPKKTSSWS